MTVIARIWHGWTEPGENADTYEQLLRAHVLPGIHRVAGFRGAYLLRNDRVDEVEFVTVTLFETLDDVREFAGEDYETAVVPPEAQALLSRFDARSRHYETVLTPDQITSMASPNE